MQKKILFIVAHRLGRSPGQRFRFEQYLSFLEGNSISWSISYLLSQEDDAVFYKKGHYFSKFFILLKAIARRFKDFFLAKKYDAVFIFREAFFTGPAFLENLFSKFIHKKVIFDYDDAIWLFDVSEANEYLGFLKAPSKTRFIIKNSSAIIAGNSFLASYARKFNDNIYVIPTTIDTEYHKPLGIAPAKNTITIGWTGSSTTIKHFELIIPVLKKLKLKYKDQITFLLISNKPLSSPDVDIQFIPWTKKQEIEDLSKIDIGIMPLPDDMWAKGKCGFKGLQYMSMEIPTVMSPVGVNTEIIQEGINGFLASTEEEWMEKLSLLIEQPGLRKTLGIAGRQTIIDKYSVDSQKEKYLEVFNKVLHS
jgi:glycosyltransferase involved in cell wall biosynthesis